VLSDAVNIMGNRKKIYIVAFNKEYAAASYQARICSCFKISVNLFVKCEKALIAVPALINQQVIFLPETFFPEVRKTLTYKLYIVNKKTG
jgi:hypothetical protein